MRCILLTLVASLGLNATKTLEFLGFGVMHPVYPCGLIGCECNQTSEMHPVYSCGLIGCECSETIGIPRVW